MPRASQDLPRLRRIAHGRGGVVSRQELLECGFSPAVVRRRVVDGSWQQVGSAIVLAPPRSGAHGLDDQALAWILRHTFGARMRISGVLAMRHAGWRLPCQTHAVVLPDYSRTHLAGVHVLRRADCVESGEVDGLRFVPPGDAVIDCLTLLPAPEAIRLLDSVLQQRLLRPEEFARLVDVRLGRGRRGAQGLRRLQHRAMSGSRSEAEQRMAVLLRRSGTGPWVANRPIVGVDGRVVAEIDFAHEGLRIAIEVDGRAFHSDRQAFERDRERQNALVLGGWMVLRFTWEQITERPEEVIAAVQAAVAQRAGAA